MTQQFTANEVRDIAWSLDGLSRQMLRAYADLLEAQEKAVPVMVVNHVSSAEHDLPIGMKLYAHPAPADTDWKNNVLAGDMKAIVDGDGNVLYVNKAAFDRQVHQTDDALATVSALTSDAERLAEALRRTCRKMKTFSRTGALDGAVAVWVDEIESVIAAHAAQAQPPAASVTDAPVPIFSWQPIETAPKNNKRPLLLARFNDDGSLQSFDYDASWMSESESWEIPEVYFFWASANGNVEEPTHWAYQPAGFGKIEAALATQENLNG